MLHLWRSYSTKMKEKCVSLTKILFLKKFKASSVSLHFPPKRVLKNKKKIVPLYQDV